MTSHKGNLAPYYMVTVCGMFYMITFEITHVMFFEYLSES